MSAITTPDEAARAAFRQAAARAAQGTLPASPASVGLLGEKTLHRAVKLFLEPDEALHEQKIGPYVADILNGQGAFEVQTRGFYRLGKKLPSLLALAPVTVVYPLPRLKWLVWVDPKTGEASPRRRSGKTYGPLDALPELFWLAGRLSDPRLAVRLIFIDLVEIRLLDGWGNGGKRGSSRADRIPLELSGDIALCSPGDYAAAFLPGLPSPFTAKDLQKAGRLSPRGAASALRVLLAAGVVRQEGKCGRAFLYIPVSPPPAQFPAETGCKPETNLLK